jgi:hypothetical protein
VSRRLLIDVVCRNPVWNGTLSRVRDDGSWKVRVAERDGIRWRTIDRWSETFVCPDCKTDGYVEFADMFRANFKRRRRVRVPTRPPL